MYMSVIKLAPLDTTGATLRSINEEASNGIEFRLRSSRAGGSSGTLQESTFYSNRKSRRRKSCREVTLSSRAGSYDWRKKDGGGEGEEEREVQQDRRTGRN